MQSGRLLTAVFLFSYIFDKVPLSFYTWVYHRGWAAAGCLSR